MTDSALLPCPFCGGPAGAHLSGVNDVNWYSYGSSVQQVECDECGALGPAGFSEEEARANWNNRGKPLPEAADAGEATR